MFKIGDIALKSNKEVKIIAEASDGRLVCRYIEDIEGKHINRCYLYYPHELTPIKQSLLPIFNLHIIHCQKEVGVVPYSKYPSSDEIVAQIKNFNGTDASVKKTYKLV